MYADEIEQDITRPFIEVPGYEKFRFKRCKNYFYV